ncbi:MAG: bis(5'-nucleosyl)-tetraphosphatase (symmetrical) YqeK [Clostridia bacterium]|nr:bis(5'-nucleosyl)-tetraphosphatase (symmetrical) YqeK [Clostridia bacterium]
MTECKKLDALRKEITNRLGEYRAKHVLSTEEEAVRIAEVYLPEKIEKVRISALLHDITKEYEVKKQLQILSDFDIIIDNVIMNSPKVFHAMTAALLIPNEFSEFSDDEVISAVKNHTCGHKDMSLMDMIIYLADYIEPLRRFEDCQKLREYFWSGVEKTVTAEERILHLYRTMVMSFDLTVENLLAEKAVIMPETFEARNAFVLKCMSISEGKINERAK